MPVCSGGRRTICASSNACAKCWDRRPVASPCRPVCQSGYIEEQTLVGGIANAGKVIRVGPHVLRPPTEHTPSIHAFLLALRRVGFEGASLPDWSQADTALASIARLLRQMHDAAHSFDPRGHSWHHALSDPEGGAIVCHNDVEPSNVVFRDGIAVGFIDFEFAAPGRPVYDLAQMARVCVPMDDELDRARLGYGPADQPARLRLVADAYGLDQDGRAELLTAMDDAFDRIEAAVQQSVDAGDPNVMALWARTGGSERFDRRRRWWAEHHHQFVAALL